MQLIQGDCIEVLKTLPDQSVQTIVTSPPYYGLRDYGVSGQIGLEPTPDEYVAKLVSVFRECRRVLRDDGTLWLNLGDSYTGGGAGRNDGDHRADGRPGGMSYKATGVTNLRGIPDGLKPKDLIGIPWRVAFALQADGWYLRSDIIWHKPNPMPESVKDRPTKAHEYIFLLAKSRRYYYDSEAVKEKANYPNDNRKSRAKENHKSMPNGKRNGLRPGTYTYDMTMRNRRSVWTVATQPYKEAHFATYPAKLIEPCILAGCPVGGTVLDPFNGSGTTGAVALKHGRDYIGIELNPEYIELTYKRLAEVQPRLEAL